MFGYHVTNWWPLQEEEYKNEMAVQAEVEKANPVPVVDLENMVPMTAQTDLASGQDTYKKICSVCHGQNGEGLIGPNFTDEYWIHGDSVNNAISIKNLYQVVIDGVIEKGMIPYKDQLSPVQIQQVLSYILTLQGTSPANQKAAQGAKYDKIG
jgi:cytochrome c oxidase cbb3-type subunit 3